MKINAYLSMAALAGVAAVAFFASCSRQKEIEAPPLDELPVTGVHTVVFNALQGSTRAQFGELENGQWPTLWTDNDSELKLSLNYGGAQTASVSPSEDYRSATFSAEIDFTGVASPYKYYAISPTSAAKALSPSRAAWKVSIPCEQTPSAGSADEAAIIIAASSAGLTSTQADATVDLQFEHLTAYGRLSLLNLSLQDETLQAVELTATTPLAGDWYWKCDAGSEGHELIDYGASSTITINTSRTEGIWFGCAPADLSNEILVVSALTSKGVWKKEILLEGTYTLQAGQCAVFSVDMSSDAEYTAYGSGTGTGSGSFELVTDASTLAAGDEVLLVCTSEGKALGALNSGGNFRDPVDVSISNGSIASAGSATVLTLEAGSSSGTWAFKDGSNYLCSASSNNYLRNSATKDANSSWSVDISSTGLATICAQAGSSTYLSFNSSSPRFSCYSNTNQKQVSIYRRSASSGSSGPGADPMLARSNYGCWLGTGLEWEYNPGTDQVTRSYDEYRKLTYTLIDPAEVEEFEIGGYAKGLVKGDDCLVTVRWRRGRTTLCSESYPMSVVKEDGPKVWLSNGLGKGVIIKK